jgi:phosphatidate cytidylyltransferase
LASSLFGIFYVGWMGAHFTLLQSTPVIGPGLVTILMLAVAVTDAFAYLGGRAFGRTKLAPLISPNKTREGAVSGFLFTLLAMLILWTLRKQGYGDALPDWSLPRYIGTGAVLSVVGQIGDLAESCLKRSAGVKDSGSIFPGHGGVLDRCDGMLFAAPVLYYMIASPF